jgi:pseudouridine-5'-phosphate glycosidase
MRPQSAGSIPAALFQIAPQVEAALRAGQPVVALESTVIAHGLPRPTNLESARRCEATIRAEGAVPATVGVIDGVVTVGLSNDQLERLALTDGVRKISRRDFGIAVARRELGATTVAATMIAARMAGIQVFATGGIGGVHRGTLGDVSADLPELARTSVAVVCSGAKAILDLPRTLEWLETAGVPVVGYGCETFPAFYAASSGLPVDVSVRAPAEAAAIIRAKWTLGLEGGVLIAVPPPANLALPPKDLDVAVQGALAAAREAGISGKALTPFLLARVGEYTAGRSVTVNVALLEQNARIGARIAAALGK